MPSILLHTLKENKLRGKSFIYIFTGNGGGKTIAALGFALRALGHRQRVVVIQFMKGKKNTGEYKIQKKLGSKFKVYQFGTRRFVNLKRPTKSDRACAVKGLEFAKKILKKKPNLLILDEINLATAIALLKVDDVLSFLKSVPAGMNVVLTGREAPKEFVSLADGVSEIKKIKHTFDKGIPARPGVEF